MPTPYFSKLTQICAILNELVEPITPTDLQKAFNVAEVELKLKEGNEHE